MKTWLAGKKTYLLALLVCLVTLALVFTHRLTPQVALAIALMAMSGLSATFRAAIERHHAEALAVLLDVSEAGAAVAAHNYGAALNAGKDAAAVGVALAQECEQEKSA